MKDQAISPDDLTLTDLLKEYGTFRDGGPIIDHLVSLHNQGKIQLDISTLIKNHEMDTWDWKLRVDIKDMSAYGVVQLLIHPMQMYTHFAEVCMVDHNTVEFRWD